MNHREGALEAQSDFARFLAPGFSINAVFEFLEEITHIFALGELRAKTTSPISKNISQWINC
jgi:hypothetical protein